MKTNNSRGSSLLEVLISAVMIAIGISALMSIVYSGKFFIKSAENKTQAISLASLKMEEYLVKSYANSDLAANCSQVSCPIEVCPSSPVLIRTKTGTNTAGKNEFRWTIKIFQACESLPVTLTNPNPKTVPYKVIETSADYNEKEPAGKIVQKTVKLRNIVSYPFINTGSAIISRESAEDNPILIPYGTSSADYKTIENSEDSLKITVNYAVPKNIMLIYNIAIRLDDTTSVTEGDTIYTGCFIDGTATPPATGISQDISDPIPVETRTPIISQPLINNAIGLNGLDPGLHHIEIKWYKSTDKGSFSLREANLMLIAFEK